MSHLAMRDQFLSPKGLGPRSGRSGRHLAKSSLKNKNKIIIGQIPNNAHKIIIIVDIVVAFKIRGSCYSGIAASLQLNWLLKLFGNLFTFC